MAVEDPRSRQVKKVREYNAQTGTDIQPTQLQSHKTPTQPTAAFRWRCVAGEEPFLVVFSAEAFVPLETVFKEPSRLQQEAGGLN